MELWIRGQKDLPCLVQVNQIEVVEKDIYGDCLNKTCLLGTYKTNKRALEVLDEIEKLLHPMIKVKSEYKRNNLTGKYNYIEDKEYININTKLFIMPEK